MLADWVNVEPEEICAVVEARLGRYIDGHHDERTSPWGRTAAALGASYAVTHGGRLISGGLGAAKLGGPAPDEHTVYRIASMTKSFTAAAVLRLRDLGALSLSDAVTRWLPGASGLQHLDGGPPSVESLLRMASGLATDDPWGDRLQDLDRDGFHRLTQSAAISAVPAGTFEYSNYGYALLGRVVEAVTGRSFMDEISDALLAPLGMTTTTWVAPPTMATGYVWSDSPAEAWTVEPVDGPGAFGAMGGLFSTVTDIARWMSFLIDPASGGDDVLSWTSRAELQVPRTPRGNVLPCGVPPYHPVLAASYGYGLTVARPSDGDDGSGTVVWHSGGYPGFGSSMVWMPQHDVAVTVLMNGRYAPATRVALAVAHDLASQNYARPSLLGGRPQAAAGCADRVVDNDGHEPPAKAVAHPRFDELVRTVNSMLIGLAQHRPDPAGDSGGALSAALPMAINVELDQPWVARAGAIAEAQGDDPGPWAADEPEMATALRGSWRLHGEHRSIEVEMWLTPVDPWEVQVLDVTGIPTTSAALEQAGRFAADVWRATAADPNAAVSPWQEMAVAAVAGDIVQPVELIGGDGRTWARWRFTTGLGAWLVAVSVGDDGVVTEATVLSG